MVYGKLPFVALVGSLSSESPASFSTNVVIWGFRLPLPLQRAASSSCGELTLCNRANHCAIHLEITNPTCPTCVRSVSKASTGHAQSTRLMCVLAYQSQQQPCNRRRYGHHPRVLKRFLSDSKNSVNKPVLGLIMRGSGFPKT